MKMNRSPVNGFLIGRTRIISNQLGYPGYLGRFECKNFDEAGLPVGERTLTIRRVKHWLYVLLEEAISVILVQRFELAINVHNS